MELKIINKKEYPLLSRMMVESEIVFEKATPPREEIKSNLAKNLGKDEKLIVVKGIYNIYGLRKAKNIAYVYENEESLKRIEVEIKEKGKKKAPAEAKEKAEEKPQEQAKKEESKQESGQEENPKAKAEAKQEPKEQKGAAKEEKQQK